MVKTVAVLSALRKESLAFFELGGEEPRRRCGVELARRSVAGLDVVAAAGGMGTINAAASAQLLIDACRPDVLLFCGIAGSLNPRIGQGDVVVGERLECLEADMDIIAESEPHLTSFPSDARLVRLAQEELEARSFERVDNVRESGADASASKYGTLAPHAPRYVCGAIATSDLFSTEPDVLREVRGRYAADCEEMEGVAAAQVAARAGVPFLAIRSISNVCGEPYEELDGREADLVATARLAADVTTGVIARLAAEGLDSR